MSDIKYTQEEATEICKLFKGHPMGSQYEGVSLPHKSKPINFGSNSSGVGGTMGIVTGKDLAIKMLMNREHFGDEYADKILYGPLEEMPLYINESEVSAIAKYRLSIGK